ncbi:MAG: FAD-binding protein, partial [Methylacidiphilaceae bacterium]|nr:FAD-binding protein [Candidatus Methylacidiphilaceae bacterium]
MSLSERDLTEALANEVRQAHDSGIRLSLAGGETKSFLGCPVEGARLSLREHRGIVHYEPAELVLTARAGTPLAEIHHLLA